MSLNEMIYQSYVQNLANGQKLDEHESSESTTTNETSSSNIQSDVSVVESEVDERQDKEEQSSDEEEDDEPKQQLPGITQIYQQNLATAQMLHLINAQKAGKVAGESEKENVPICKYCNKMFANVSNLNHHISAIHLNQSKWNCSQCGKICSSKSNLKVHLRVHLRVKPYHCRWCSYSCMHHSSIRDHLAKVHPDKTHTPLQPGYLFNSQAVPEPEVFNSQGFNANSFTESKSKRSSTEVVDNASPEKSRNSKKMRMEKQVRTSVSSQSPVRASINPQPIYSDIQNQPQLQSQTLGQNQQSMSNLYSAYMARMLPFMYNPLQYAAAMANGQQHSSPTSQFLGMLNQGLQFNQGHQSRQNFTYPKQEGSNVFSMLSGSSSSDEQPTNSSGNYSYSGSSRSSSMSPSTKVNNQMSTSTSTDEGIQTNCKVMSPSADTFAKVSSAKKTLSIDQMLSTKLSKETQTESSCLSCPYCSGNNSSN